MSFFMTNYPDTADTEQPLMTGPYLLKRVKKVRIGTRNRSKGEYASRHTSVFRGRGIEYSDLREYVPGDDIRSIDWNVTARLNRPYVKEYAEERDQTYYFAVDFSGSGSFGSEHAKTDIFREIAASLMVAASEENERIGLCIFTDRVERFFRAKKGKRQLLHLIDVLASHQPASKGTDLNPLIRFFSSAVKKHASLIIISDFDCPPFGTSLSILGNRHAVSAIRVTDPHENELPDVGLAALEDAETGEQVIVDTSDPEFREQYANLSKSSEKEVVSTVRGRGAKYISLSSMDRYDLPLTRFFSGHGSGRR